MSIRSRGGPQVSDLGARRRGFAVFRTVAAAVAVALSAGTAAFGVGPASAAAPIGPGLAATIPVGGDGVAVDPSTHNVYILGPGGVSVVDESGDAHSGQVIAEIAIADDPNALAVDPSTHNVYVTSPYGLGSNYGTLSVIDESGDAHTGRVIGTANINRYPSAVAVDPSTHNVYVTNAPDTVSVIDESGDANSGKVTATVNVGLDPTAIAVDRVTHKVYVGSSNETVSVIDESGDANTGKVTATVNVGDFPSGIAVDPVTHTVYVGGFDGSLVTIDESGADAGHVVGTTLINGNVVGVAVDPVTHYVYVANRSAATTMIFDESGNATTGKLVATVRVHPYPLAMAIDPSTHNVYVTSQYTAQTSVLELPADLGISLSGPSGSVVGSSFSEQVMVTDNGPFMAPHATTNLLIPEGLAVTAAPGAEIVSGTLIWTTNSIAVGGSVTYTVTFAAAAGVHAGIEIGGVVESYAVYDPDPANNAAIAIIRIG